MSYYVGACLVFLLALTEAAVLPYFRVEGLQPNLVLVLLVAWLTLRGYREAFVMLIAGGMFIGLVDGAPLGTALLALSPLVLLNEVRGSHLRQGGFVVTLLFVIAMTLAYHTIYLAAFTLSGATGSWDDAFTRVVLPTTVLNAAALLPTYILLAAASQERRRPIYA